MTDITLEKLLAGPVETTDSQLKITMPTKKLDVGEHTLTLEVVDSGNNKSQPVIVKVIVIDRAPVAAIDLRDLSGGIIQRNAVKFGQGFILSGKRSQDPDGQAINKFIWTLER